MLRPYLSRLMQTHSVRREPSAPQPDYAAALAAELAATTSAEVRFDTGSRAAWSTDASNYRHVPIGVVLPRTIDDVIRTVALCRKYGAPITARGGGTSLAGQACNVAVIIDYSKYLNRVLEIDPARRIARVEPGCILDDLRGQAARHGLTFGPDPATHSRNTLGGMIGNNSCGVHSVMSQFYGPGPLTRHQVIELDLLTYDGERFTVAATSDAELETIIAAAGRRGAIYHGLRELRDTHAAEIRSRFVNIPRRVSGYNLDALLPEHGFNVAHALVGTEGTCAIILGATVTLIPARPVRTLLVLGYRDAYQAADHVPEIMLHQPVGLEGFDGVLVEMMRKRRWHPDQVALLPPGDGWLMVEFGADIKADADAQAERLMQELAAKADAPSMRLCESDADAKQLWEIREAALGVSAHPPGMRAAYEGWEDAAVAPERLGAYLRDLSALIREFKYTSAMYGHFGQGCVHFRIDFDFESVAGVEAFSQFLERAADLVVSHGGAISGEHGDGQARAIFLTKMYGENLIRAFERFKWLWDPDNRMNPGKVVHPRRPDQDLRIQPGYADEKVETHFAFRGDDGSFARATARCAGVGACRRTGGGTMCPSYMVTHEEEDSTRGRARMLFEMMEGEVLTDGWRNEHVKDALDLCLACKGCKSECPVNVDMATYKAEFLSHYYQGRVRPRTAYAMGLIYWWARAAAPIAPLVNFFTRTRPFSSIMKAAGGIAQERTIPQFASPTFRSWFRGHKRNTDAKRRVILWPDTFSNYLHPAAAIAAVEVLEHAGFAVDLPRRPLCCGRPLYDWGMLDRAKQLWRQTLDTLRDDIRAGVPIVGLEPSCVAAFRDELSGLFPDDEDAQRLAKQTFMLSEFLVNEGYQPPSLRRRAVVHGHCHHKAVIGMQAEERLLKAVGLDYRLLDSGCCGMAGSFGFEAHKYDVSVKAAERVLLPAVRTADNDTLIIANGFSCHEQIAQLAGRTPLHLAQVLQMALHAESPSLRSG
jgi:FAD/FMN-containing dehydrogenase/Fe-S oxidoreductase